MIERRSYRRGASLYTVLFLAPRKGRNASAPCTVSPLRNDTFWGKSAFVSAATPSIHTRRRSYFRAAKLPAQHRAALRRLRLAGTDPPSSAQCCLQKYADRKTHYIRASEGPTCVLWGHSLASAKLSVLGQARFHLRSHHSLRGHRRSSLPLGPQVLTRANPWTTTNSGQCRATDAESGAEAQTYFFGSFRFEKGHPRGEAWVSHCCTPAREMTKRRLSGTASFAKISYCYGDAQATSGDWRRSCYGCQRAGKRLC